PGPRAPVQTLWARRGVTPIYARNPADLYFAQGYVAASERLFQIELAFRFGSGRLAEVFGEVALPFDRFIRTVGWNWAAQRLVDQWDDLSWEMSRAFSAGARAWIERMPARPIEYDILQRDPLFPEMPEAAVLATSASVFMVWTLSTNWDAELLRAELAE